jgi:hypothetical protein
MQPSWPLSPSTTSNMTVVQRRYDINQAVVMLVGHDRTDLEIEQEPVPLFIYADIATNMYRYFFFLTVF